MSSSTNSSKPDYQSPDTCTDNDAKRGAQKQTNNDANKHCSTFVSRTKTVKTSSFRPNFGNPLLLAVEPFAIIAGAVQSISEPGRGGGGIGRGVPHVFLAAREGGVTRKGNPVLEEQNILGRVKCYPISVNNWYKMYHK